jgi:hypothetical protein
VAFRYSRARGKQLRIAANIAKLLGLLGKDGSR